MEKFVRLTAPTGKLDFCLKLFVFLLICGGFNHLRHILTYGLPVIKSYWVSFFEASFTALPMCAFALVLIGHLNSLQQRLSVQATRDHLTKLPNRRWFMANTPTRIGPKGVLMIIDIDHFKRINDEFGHDAGDRCLQDMAQHLQDTFGDGPKFARIGGEEFAVFWPDVSLPDLRRAAQAMSAGFQFHATDTATVTITASVGVAIHPLGLARADAMKLADRATYEAKSRGRANYVMLHEAA